MSSDYIETSLYVNKKGYFYNHMPRNHTVTETLEWWTFLLNNETRLTTQDDLLANDDCEYLWLPWEKFIEAEEDAFNDDEANWDKTFDEENFTAVQTNKFFAEVFNRVDNQDIICGETSETDIGDDWALYRTGGMSWGDSPTEAYDVMIKLQSLPTIVQDFLGVSVNQPVTRHALHINLDDFTAHVLPDGTVEYSGNVPTTIGEREVILQIRVNSPSGQ